MIKVKILMQHHQLLKAGVFQLLLLLLPLFVVAQQPFEKTYGDSRDQAGYSILKHDVYYYISGYTETVSEGKEVLLLKLTTDGDVVWSKTFGTSTHDEEGYSLQLTSSEDLLISANRSNGPASSTDLYFVKVDTSGNVIFTQTIDGGDRERVMDVYVDASDDIYVSAITESFGAGMVDNYYLKMNSSGAIQWQQAMGSILSDGIGTFVPSSTPGALWFCGNVAHSSGTGHYAYINEIDQNGNLLNEYWYGSTTGAGSERFLDMVRSADSNLYLVGRSDLHGAIGEDVLISKVDEATGTPIWSNIYGGTGSDRGLNLIEGQGNTFYFTATTNSVGNGDQGLLVKMDENGDTLWTREFGGTGDDFFRHRVQHVLEEPSGSVVLVMTTTSFGAGGMDVYLIKTSPTGTAPCTPLHWGNLTYLPATINTATPSYTASTPSSTTGTAGTAGTISLVSESTCPVEAGFTYTTFPCNDTVAFTDTTIPMPDAWRWVFTNVATGVSDTSFVQNPNQPLVGTSPLTDSFLVELVVTKGMVSDTARDTVVLNYGQPVTVMGDTSLCQGDSIQLFASGATTYDWSPDSTLSDTDVATPWASPWVTETYRLNFTTTAGCSLDDSLTVTVVPNVEVTACCDTFICPGSTIQLQTGGTPGVSYAWTPASSLDDSTLANPLASPTVSTIYKVYASIGRCVDSATVDVEVVSPPNVDAGNDTAICFGDTIQLQGSGDGALLWSPAASLSNPNIASPFAFPTQTTEYHLIVQDPTFGCTNMDTVVVTVNPLPQVTVADTFENICRGTTATLAASGGTSYLWSTGQTGSTVIVSPDVTSTYWVKAVAQGCVGPADSITVQVDSFTIACGDLNSYIWVPTAFSPNGDSLNDRMTVVWQHLDTAEITIYNRWGQLIYKADFRYTGWNGKHRGKPVPEGTYVWKIDARGEDQEVYHLNGTVMVLYTIRE